MRDYRKEWFKEGECRRLHLGRNMRVLDGWLNADADVGEGDGRYPVDLGERLLFSDGCFDFIYFDRLLETMDYHEGLRLLWECRRLLAKDGVVRIVSVDLEMLAGMYLRRPRGLELDYIRWVTDEFLPRVESYSEVFVFNYMMRAWDHKFLYDRDTLSHALYLVGFKNVECCGVKHSVHEDLEGLEPVERMPEGFYEFESFVVEAGGVREEYAQNSEEL